jgi:hypothetical protein
VRTPLFLKKISITSSALAISALTACASAPPERPEATSSPEQFNALLEQQPTAAGVATVSLFNNGPTEQDGGGKGFILRTRLASLNTEGLNSALQGSAPVALNLFDDFALSATQTERYQSAPNRTSWTGIPQSDPWGLVSLVADNGHITGTVMTQGHVFDIRAQGDGTHRISEINASVLPDELAPLAAPANRAKPTANTPAATPSAIDVLVVYTPNAERQYPDIAQRIQVAIDQANASFRNSGVSARLRLVGSRSVDYRESGNAKYDLETLSRNTKSGLGLAHRLRDELGADVVSLWTANAGNACGAAYDFAESGEYAFNTVAVTCATNTLSFANVIGRNLGLGSEDGKGGAFAYSQGHVDSRNGWRTLDASSSACRANGGYCYRLPLVSNPNSKIGNSIGGHENANNARTLGETFRVVAAYRGGSSGGTGGLVSVSDELFSNQLSDNAKRALQEGQYQPPTAPYVKRWRLVNLQQDNLPNALPTSASDQQEVALTLFPGVRVVAKQDSMEFRSQQMASWSGKIEGMESGQVNLVLQGSNVTGLASTPQGRFFIRPVGGGAHEIIEIDQSKMPKDHPEQSPMQPASIAAAGDTASAAGTATNTTTSGDFSGPIIDVMVAYTQTAYDNNPDYILSDIQLAIDVTNTIYANSGINQRVRLVKAHLLAGYQETGQFQTELSRLANAYDGYMDDVKTIRDNVGADMVVEWTMAGDYCGLAYVLADPPTGAEYTYSIVSRACATMNLSFPHELGHNMGMQHDMYVSAGQPSAYTYSHGYASLAGSWRTVMAYNDYCVANGTSCPRIEHFSNPNKTYNGLTTGDSNSDGALTLNNTAPIIASFRPNKQSQYLSMYVSGSFNNWGGNTTVGIMNWKGNGEWESVMNLPAGTSSYKFVANGGPTHIWGDDDEATSSPQAGAAGYQQGDINLQIAQNGNYVFKFNENTLAYSVTLQQATNIKRTVIFMYGTTQPGQDMFMRGGIDWGYSKNTLGKDCGANPVDVNKWLCAIPITHNIQASNYQRSNDKFLDWYGAESGQGVVEGSPLIWTTNAWPSSWGAKKTVALDGFGEDPENKWGHHYWKLDVQMDCSKTVNGWFELKSYISNGPGWEGNVSQAGAPYTSWNHFGKCGSTNMFRRNESAATITPLP